MSAKKSNKKEVVEATYEVRDVVLGKVKGFPYWPGMVVEPDSVPTGVRRERPSNKKTVFYVVQFFPAGDYAWLTSKDISKLQKHEIEAYIAEPAKKSGDLLAGYRIALDPTQWEKNRAAQIAGAEEEEEEEEGPEQVDELASGGEDESRGKKRRKNTSSAVGGSKKRKKEDSSSVSAGGKGSKKRGESTSVAATKKGAKGGRKNGKTKVMVESEDEGGAGAEEEEATGGASKRDTPPAAKKGGKKDENEENADPEAVKVREWRHKLQKTFLSNKTATPKESEMPAMDHLFTTIEKYDKMDIHYLQFSKIGKVMRHIAALASDKVPTDEQYHFKDRAKALVDKWQVILASVKEGTVNGTTDGAPTTNGNGNQSTNVKRGAGASPTTNGARKKAAPNGVNEDTETGMMGDTSVLADVTMSEAGIDG
ncbi:hypothetical protein E1B28_000038 [Marasmius oreades]|uniref:PWWP domain-containing protein n=1 Tax=Marasmius oreades TaxID=181124 RepID=A0A9P7V0H0_9AGAR|nr:uncharacterized protein E1B28_000038 [Marasmius oreades]KAG7098064.1 hypothetical protein E1B28_000038 [Marasmius oreades]